MGRNTVYTWRCCSGTSTRLYDIGATRIFVTNDIRHTPFKIIALSLQSLERLSPLRLQVRVPTVRLQCTHDQLFPVKSLDLLLEPSNGGKVRQRRYAIFLD